MGRPKHASYYKSQAKTADIRRAVPGALAHNQAHGSEKHFSYSHTQKPNVWDITPAMPEICYDGSFLTRNLPPPPEALMDSATALLDSILSDFRATQTPMPPLANSTDLMDCDLTPSELMDVDDVNLDGMNVDVAGSHALSLDAVPMDIAEDPWSMAIFAVRPSASAPPSFPAFTDEPMTPLQVCPATPHWKEVRAELSLARRELALVAKALQCLPVCALHSPVQDPPMKSPVQSIPDFAHSTRKSPIAPAVISSAFHSPEQHALCVDPGVEVVVKGIRNLDISDDSNRIPSTPLDEPIPLAVPLPEIQPEVLSPGSESSDFSQELDAFTTADLLGLDSAEPLHSTPIDGGNGKSPDAFGIWADMADLQMHNLYADFPIPSLPDDDFISFPSSLITEFVSVFDLPAVDRRPRSTEAVDVLPCSEAKVGVVDRVKSSEISDKDASANVPCQSVVLVPDNGLYDANFPFASQIGSEEIVQMMKNRAERHSWKTSTQESGRREANVRSASEPCSPSAPEPLSQVTINVSMPNHTPISTSLLPKKLNRTDTKNGISNEQGISNMDISERPSFPIVSHFRLSSHKQHLGTPTKETPSCAVGKENAPSINSSRSPSTWRPVHKEKIVRATKQRALSSPHPLSTINQNIQRIPLPMSSSSSIHSKRIPARRRKAASSNSMPSTTSCTPSSLLATSTILSNTTSLESTTPIPEARVIHLPYAHSLMRQRNKCVMSPKAPHSCLARTKGHSAFFAPNERHSPRHSSAYPRLKDTSDDTFHSYAESSTRSPSPDAAEAQLIRSQKMGLYSAGQIAPEWLVTEATKNKVLPGAVPTTDYHEDIVPSTPTKVYQPQWFRRLKGILFGW